MENQECTYCGNHAIFDWLEGNGDKYFFLCIDCAALVIQCGGDLRSLPEENLVEQPVRRPAR